MSQANDRDIFDDATGRGAYYCIKELERKRGWKPDDIRVAVQGFGNAGGVTVSYFEWVQNKSGYYWTIDEVHTRLHAIMAREFNAVYEFMEQKDIDMRTAAYALALTRIGEAIASQGTARYFSGD